MRTVWWLSEAAPASSGSSRSAREVEAHQIDEDDADQAPFLPTRAVGASPGQGEATPQTESRDLGVSWQNTQTVTQQA